MKKKKDEPKEMNCSDCCRRLDLIARLLMIKHQQDQPKEEQESMVDLTKRGFTAGEIGCLLGKTENAVRITQTRLRKKGLLEGIKNG